MTVAALVGIAVGIGGIPDGTGSGTDGTGNGTVGHGGGTVGTTVSVDTGCVGAIVELLVGLVIALAVAGTEPTALGGATGLHAGNQVFETVFAL